MKVTSRRALRLATALLRPAAAAPDPDPHSFARTRDEMLARQHKAVYDTLSPMQSHLLNISLSDDLPEACYPAHFDRSRLTLPSRRNAPPLPQGHHLVYFPPQMPPSQLLPDGTDPAHSPGGPYVRRMWAGGSVAFADGWRDVLRLDGRRAVCVESVDGVVLKQGARPGEEKIFVDVARRYGPVSGEDDAGAVAAARREPVIEEVRTLVFMRELRQPVGGKDEATRKVASRLVKAPYDPTFTISLRPSATLLFHYSALTFNAHAIHLDPQYCRAIEGHRGLLVHGPLSLTLMLSALRSQLDTNEYIRRIEYRNHAPLYAGEEMRVCLRRNANGSSEGKKWDAWVEGPEGGLAVKAVAVS